MMDDEDLYGIPSDYYHSESMLQHYAESAPISFDNFLDPAETFADGNSFEDFSECMRVVGAGPIQSKLIFML
jgi:hypothetical protein